MVNGEDDLEIMNWQNPFLLRFQPLRFLESPTLGTMAILSGFVVKFPLLTFGIVTQFEYPAHCRRAAIDNRTHGFLLLIRKPMSFFICAHMFAEDVSHVVFHP